MSASPPYSDTQPGRSAGRCWLLLGLGLAALGIAGYAGQIAARRLVTPWYMPALASLGAALVARSLWQRVTLWRAASFVLVGLLAAAEWMFVLGTRLPADTGMVAVGRSFPEFETVSSDGAPFARRDLEGDENHLLVFFRGRW
jgi:hypothetical protein